MNQNPEWAQRSFSRYRHDREANPDRTAVLVVEDNLGDIFLIQESIAAHHLDVDIYLIDNGQEAIIFFQLLHANSIRCPNILLLDLNLPKLDGFEILAYLRASGQRIHMPVIVMSSSSAIGDQNKSASYNVNAYFHKPSSYVEFLAIGELIETHLGGV